MSLYSYKKNHEKNYKYSETIILNDTTHKGTYLGKGPRTSNFKLSNVLSNSYLSLKNLTTSSKLAGLLIPSFFIILGVVFIYKEFFPDIQQSIQIKLGYLSQGNTSPVSDQFIDLSKYISKPVDLPNLTNNALKENILQNDTKSRDYQGTFYISIPSLNFNRLPIQANVDSTVPDAYMKVLNSKLAHFKSTGLPISNVNNNIVIYGHSASPNYNPKSSDPEVAFSFLSNLQVGDDIYLYFDNNQTYHYKMYKSKIVDPSDVSIITGTAGKRTLTLFTCAPAGSDLNRLVVIARPVDDTSN